PPVRASRRMAATHGLAAILRDAAQSALLLRMRQQIHSHALRMRSVFLHTLRARSLKDVAGWRGPQVARSLRKRDSARSIYAHIKLGHRADVRVFRAAKARL